MFILAYADIIIPGEPKMMCRDEIIIALKEYKILPLIIIIGSKMFFSCVQRVKQMLESSK